MDPNMIFRPGYPGISSMRHEIYKSSLLSSLFGASFTLDTWPFFIHHEQKWIETLISYKKNFFFWRGAKWVEGNCLWMDKN